MLHARFVKDLSLLELAQNRIREDLKLNTYFDPYTSLCMAIDNSVELYAIVIFHNYQVNATIETSIVSFNKKWFSKSMCFQFFNYCFNIAKVKRIYTQVCASNHVALDMNKRLGFKEMAVLPDFVLKTNGEITDNHIFSMTKDECKWLWADKAQRKELV